MDNQHIITADTLVEITGYSQFSRIEQYLSGHGIEYFSSKNGPWTTLELINRARGMPPVHLPSPRKRDIL